MSVTFDDPPGTLPSRAEPINFTSTRPVTDVRAVYDEEQAFDGTAFASPFLGSERTGNVFTVRRTGNWNRNFRIQVEEQTQTLLEVATATSYAAQPFDLIAVDASGAGTKTITLPTAGLLDGMPIAVAKTGSAADVVLSGPIDGAGSLTLTENPERVVVRYDKDDSEWKVIAHEVPTASGGIPLGSIYSVDYTTLPAQGSFAQGAISIDGLTYYAKGALTGMPFGVVMENDLTAGQGIRFRNTTAQGIPMTSGSVNYLYRHMVLPLANVPDYNPAAPAVIRFRGVQTGWSGNNHGLVCGLVSSTNDGVALAAADRQYDSLVLTYEGSREYKRGTSGANSAGSIAAAANNGAAVYNFFGTWTIELTDPSAWSGSFSSLGTWTTVSTTAPPFATSARPNPGVFFGIRGQVNTSPVYFTHLEILQPRVP